MSLKFGPDLAVGNFQRVRPPCAPLVIHQHLHDLKAALKHACFDQSWIKHDQAEQTACNNQLWHIAGLIAMATKTGQSRFPQTSSSTTEACVVGASCSTLPLMGRHDWMPTKCICTGQHCQPTVLSLLRVFSGRSFASSI